MCLFSLRQSNRILTPRVVSCTLCSGPSGSECSHFDTWTDSPECGGGLLPHTAASPRSLSWWCLGTQSVEKKEIGLKLREQRMLTLSQWFIYTKKYMALPCKPYGGLTKKFSDVFTLLTMTQIINVHLLKLKILAQIKKLSPYTFWPLKQYLYSKLQVYLYNFRGREVLSEFFCGPVDNVWRGSPSIIFHGISVLLTGREHLDGGISSDLDKRRHISHKHFLKLPLESTVKYAIPKG